MGILDDATPGVKRHTGQEYECPDNQLQRDYPGIYEWLCRILLDGKNRVPAYLTIKYREGGCSLCLAADQEEVIGWHQASDLETALEGLEKRLQQKTMDWRRKEDNYRKKR